jgi:hypothetical protein
MLSPKKLPSDLTSQASMNALLWQPVELTAFQRHLGAAEHVGAQEGSIQSNCGDTNLVKSTRSRQIDE